MSEDQVICRDVMLRVIRKHHIHKDDFFGRSKEAHLVEARIDAAKQLRAAGKTMGQISRVLKRSIDTCRYYIEPGIKRHHGEKHKANWPLAWLTPDVRQVVVAYAEAEQTTPRAIISEWVRERASYEAKAKLEAVAA